MENKQENMGQPVYEWLMEQYGWNSESWRWKNESGRKRQHTVGLHFYESNTHHHGGVLLEARVMSNLGRGKWLKEAI